MSNQDGNVVVRPGGAQVLDQHRRDGFDRSMLHLEESRSIVYARIEVGVGPLDQPISVKHDGRAGLQCRCRLKAASLGNTQWRAKAHP